MTDRAGYTDLDSAALDSETELFRGLLDAAPDATVVVDSDGLVLLVNAQARGMLGYDRSELIGQPVEVLLPDEERAAHPRHRAIYLDRPVPRRMGDGRPLNVRRRDGSTFPADITLNALPANRGFVVSAAIRDVTDRVRAEAEQDRLRAETDAVRIERRLQQSQRLESLGQLAGGVAHDFNNILGVIQGYASFVHEAISDAEGGGGVEWGQLHTDVGHILSAAERAARLTRQLLAFARQEMAAPEVLDVGMVVEEIDELLRRTIGEHVALVTRRQPGVPQVLVDRGQLEQVLVNLAVNARDALPTGGIVTIDAGVVDVDETYAGGRLGIRPGRYARIRVSDNGIGMPPEVLERAFEPFFTTKPKGQGTGLGLATVYGIVTQVGGDVQIFSEVGSGTVVNVLLPATEDASAAAADAVPDLPAGTETVLVVEDEDGIREVAHRILARRGYEVHVARGGAEALERCATLTTPVDLLLTDMVMPGMLGTEVAARIMELWPGVKTLFMSGYAQGVLGTTSTADLLEKPFSAETLLAAVRRALDSV